VVVVNVARNACFSVPAGTLTGGGEAGAIVVGKNGKEFDLANDRECGDALVDIRAHTGIPNNRWALRAVSMPSAMPSRGAYGLSMIADR